MNILQKSTKDIFEKAKGAIYAKELGYSVVVPHVCNNVNLFGAGFAADVANKYPIVKTNYHLLGKSFLSKIQDMFNLLMSKESLYIIGG
jgi:hypothetical protein